MDGILASIFLGFWSILGGKLGGKPEPRSTQKGIEKIVEKRRSTRRPKNRPQDGQQGYGDHRTETFWTQIVAGGSPPIRGIKQRDQPERASSASSGL